jgi:hypothetical protein
MTFVHEGYVAIIFVTLTIILQSAGMAALIQWIKAQFPRGIHRLGFFSSFVLVVRFTSLLILLHVSEILLWASFYRWKCFPSWDAAFYFSAADYATVGAGDLLLKPNVANDGAGRKPDWCTDVRALRKFPVCPCDPARSTRGSGTSQPRRRCTLASGRSELQSQKPERRLRKVRRRDPSRSEETEESFTHHREVASTSFLSAGVKAALISASRRACVFGSPKNLRIANGNSERKVGLDRPFQWKYSDVRKRIFRVVAMAQEQ